MHHLNKRRRIAEKVEGGGNKKIEKKDYGEEGSRKRDITYFVISR
jgi:hypothetical protein